MKKVFRRFVIITLELVAVVIVATAVVFAMFTLGNGIRNFSFKIPETEKETVAERRPRTEETEKQSETQEAIIILEEPQVQQSESQEQLQTETQSQQTENPIVIIDEGGSSEDEGGEEIVEFFTEKGTFFY